MSLITAYLVDTVVHVVSNGVDQWNNPIAPTSTTRFAMIEYGSKLVIDTEGEKVVSSARIKLEPDVVVSHEDNFTFDGETHYVLAISRPRDFRVQFKVVAVK